MRKTYAKRSIVCALITLYMLVMPGNGYAAGGPEVNVVVNPKTTEAYAGSEKIVITVIASGRNLTFIWKLSGPGKLEGEGAAAFYTPPKTIEKDAEFAIITVTVKDSSGEATIESVPFTILSRPEQGTSPVPEPAPGEKKGMSRGTKIALGAGAVVALGAGVALLASDESKDSCGGTQAGGHCWYFGAAGASCDNVCASHGGYHEATRTYAGSEGTTSNCDQLLNMLGAPADPSGTGTINLRGLGCYYSYGTNSRWRDTYPTLSNASSSNRSRVCACQK